jgi:hypothetical protein
MMLLRAYWDAARDVAPEAAAASDEGTVMRWCGEGELAELWQAAGLRDVRFQPLIVRARYSNFEDLWSPFPRGVAPSGVFCKTLSDQDRAALHDAYRRRLGVGDQPFELTARAWSVAGRAPESCSLTRLEVPLWSSHAHLPRLSGSLELRGLRDDVGYARARAGSPTRRWRIRGVAGGLGDVPCFRFGADARI